MLCLIETDLHSSMSRHRRTVILTRNDICNVLNIPGYKIYLPATWKYHGQSRMLVYAKEELKVCEKQLEASLNDLPILTFEIGLGLEKRIYKWCDRFEHRTRAGGKVEENDKPLAVSYK